MNVAADGVAALSGEVGSAYSMAGSVAVTTVGQTSYAPAALSPDGSIYQAVVQCSIFQQKFVEQPLLRIPRHENYDSGLKKIIVPR